MIDPTTSQIQSNTLKQTSNRDKLDAQKRVQQEHPERPAPVGDDDQLQLTAAQTERSERRTTENPIEDEREAGEVISFTGSSILANAGLAELAQGNLNPDKVLELIA